MLGTLHLERQAWSEAVTCFERALAEDPRYPAALVNRAFASFELGRSGAAVDDLTLALDLVGEDPDLLLNRGIAHAANGSTQLAMDDYTRALALPGADIAELERHRERCLTSGSSRSLPAADGSGPAGTAR
jgi:tetratricopeptide (TPR) repeat protein